MASRSDRDQKLLQFLATREKVFEAVLACIKLLKDKGNAAMKNGRLQEALGHYSEALSLGKRQPALSKEVAIVYSNRSAVNMKLNRTQAAFQDAQDCIQHDPKWPKGYWRKGQIQKSRQQYIDAFHSLLNGYKRGEKGEEATSCLVDAVRLLDKVKDHISAFQELVDVGKSGISAVIERLVKSSDWSTLHLMVLEPSVGGGGDASGGRTRQLVKGVSVGSVNLSGLAEVALTSQAKADMWYYRLLDALLTLGAPVASLAASADDTPWHVALRLALSKEDTSVLEKALKWNISELKTATSYKNSLLHTVSLSYKVNCPIALKVAELLLKAGVDPVLKNGEKKTSLDILPIGSEIANLVKKYQKPEAEDNKKKGTPAERPDLPRGVASKQPAKTNVPEKKPARDLCDRCEMHVKNAQEYHSKGLNTEAVESVCKYINISSHYTDRHKRLYKEGIDELVAVFTESTRPDVPMCLMKVRDQVYQHVLQTLADQDKWRQVETLLVAWTADKPLSNSMAVGLCIEDVIRSNSLQGDSNYRRQVVNVLLKNGARLSGSPEIDDEPITIALRKSDFRVIPILIEHGASPSKFHLAPGDTPLHAALQVALELDKGYFVLFDKLLQLFDGDKVKYRFLDPSCVDKDSNSLYHLAAKCNYSKHAQRVIEVLCERRVPGGKKDNSDRTPLDYITKPNDRRRQFLRTAASYGQSKHAADKKNRASGSKSTHSKKKIGSTVQKDLDKDEDFGRPDVTPEQNEDSGKCYQDPVQLAKTRKLECYKAISIHINGLADFVPVDTNAALGESEGKARDDIDSDVESSPPSSRSASPVDNDTFEIAVAIEQGLLEMDDNDEDIHYPQDFEIKADIFDDLEWEVECTAEVWKILKDKRIPFDLKKRVILKVQQLASGEWTDSLTKEVHNVPKSLKLYEAKVSKGGRILWELAVAFSPRYSESAETILNGNQDGPLPKVKGQIYAEVIRVWDIVLQHDKLYQHIQRISRSHGRGENSIIQKRLESLPGKQTALADNRRKRLPLVFVDIEAELDSDKDPPVGSLPLFPPASPSETEYHIMKFYSFSSALVTFILQKTETKVDFPFRVTDLEHAIISLQSKCPVLLLGRSGTGKTTCCLYRLWDAYLKYWTKALEADAPLLPRSVCFVENRRTDSVEEEPTDDSDLEEGGESENCDSESEAVTRSEPPEEEIRDVMDHLHQIFITKNAVLCSEVMKNFQELSHASDLTHSHVSLEDNSLPNRLQDVPDQMFPLFVTSRQLLLVLDASLPGIPFFEREEDGSLKRDIKGWTDDESPLAFIPNMDSDSEEEDEDGNESGLVDDEDGVAGKSSKSKRLDPRREVTYEVFAQELWPKMKSEQKTDYHSSLVWTEINSFIKGSFEAIGTSNGCLKMEKYQELGRKRAPNFTGERNKVYKMFQRYEHMKKQKGLFDECDLLLDIYRRLCNAEKLDWAIHQLYVDETQDFTQAELCLLLRLCQNPNDMFLTGDTAQGIMRGISFRFSDLKSLFFHARRSLQAMGKSEAISVPKRVYQLTHNYRSHAGILALASSVVDLMVEFFPESFDRLKKDQGLFHGPLPVLLESCSFGDLALLLRGNRRQTSEIEFGAHQAILVANDAAREAVPEELQMGLVLTIFEAKGLEFDDVLLFNFFKDSQAKKEWRVVTDYLERLSKSASDHRELRSGNLTELDMESMKASTCRPLTFNPEQHKVLCSEFKHLYTALTRARVHVWIFDEDQEARAPMFDYFKARRLVNTITETETEDEGIADALFAERSSPADWIKRGDDFMKHHLYDVAAKCYERGGNEDKENLALAHSAALKASRHRDNPAKMREEFLFAAEQYLVKCGLKLEAARCLQNAREREMAARLYEKIGAIEKAGGLYKRCSLVRDASRCYEQQGLYREAVTLLVDNDYFDLAIDVLKRFQMRIKEYESQNKEVPAVLQQNAPSPLQTVERLTLKAAKFYHKKGNHQMMSAALDRLPELDDRVTFLKKYRREIQAANLLKDAGRYKEAAILFLDEGHYMEAVECAKSVNDEALATRCEWAHCKHQMARGNLSTFAADELGGETDSMREKLIQEVTELFNRFQRSGDLNLAADAKLMLAELSVDVSKVDEAWEMFNKMKPAGNEAGQVECSRVYLDLVSLESDSNICYKFASKHLPKLFKAFLVVTQKTSLKAEDSAKVKVYESYYGLEGLDELRMTFHKSRYPRCLQFLPEDESPVKRDLVKGRLRRYLLKQIENCGNHTKDAAEVIESQNSLCQDFASGMPCSEMVDSQCPNLHEQHTRKTFYSVLKALLSCVYLEAGILKSVESQRDLQTMQRLYSVLQEDAYHHARSLTKFILPERPLTKLVTENKDLVYEFLDYLRKEEIRQHFKQNVLSTQWKRMPPKDKASTTNVYLEGVLLYKILGNKNLNEIKTWISETEENHSKKGANVQGKAMIRSKTKGKEHFMCYAQRFLEAVEFIYSPKPDPVKGIFRFGKFLRLLSNKGDVTVFPQLEHLIFWMEFFLMVDLTMGAKHLQQYLIVPASYLSLVCFVDTIFGSSQREKERNIEDLFRVVNLYKMQQKTAPWYDAIVERLIDVLDGLLFGLLREAFDPTKKLIETGLAERCLVFSLTILSNVYGVVNSKFEKKLMQAVTTALSNKALTEKSLSPRLLTAITQILQANGQRDVVKALQNLLMARDKEILCECTWGKSPIKGRGWTLFNKPFENFSGLEVLFGSLSGQRNPEVLQAFEEQMLSRTAEEVQEDDGLEMTEAEIQQKDKKERDRESQPKALEIITHSLRLCSLRRRAMSLVTHVKNEMSREDRADKLPCGLEDHFQACTLDNTMCGICGVSFISNKEDLDLSGADESPGKPVSASEESKGTKQNRFTHIVSCDHLTCDGHYICLRRYIREKVAPLFITSQSIISKQDQLNDEVVLDINRLTKGTEDVSNHLRELASTRDWSNVGNFQILAEALQSTLKDVEPIVNKCIAEKQKPKSGATAVPSSSASKLSDEEEAFEEVVAEPAQPRGRRARKTQARKKKQEMEKN